MIAIAQPSVREVDAAALPILVEDFLTAKGRIIAATSLDGYRSDLVPFLHGGAHETTLRSQMIASMK